MKIIFNCKDKNQKSNFVILLKPRIFTITRSFRKLLNNCFYIMKIKVIIRRKLIHLLHFILIIKFVKIFINNVFIFLINKINSKKFKCNV